jgi:uncharacterized protein
MTTGAHPGNHRSEDNKPSGPEQNEAMNDTDPVTLVLDALALLREARYADVAGMFAPAVRALVTAELLEAGWVAEISQKGTVRAVGEPAEEWAGPGQTLVRVPVTCERGDLSLMAVVSESQDGSRDAWLAALQLTASGGDEPPAPWQAPSYADPGAFTEEEVVVGPEGLAVPGTLTRPGGAGGRVPGVLLLAGSGLLDRDETVGQNKPFKDIAWGLATRGIAVLRFDKVTRVHPAEITAGRGYTMADEYVPQAVAALRRLRDDPAVDPERVFVAGHSLGGTVAPRVAAAAPPVAGLAILAGGAQPLHWAMVRQARYLAGLVPETAAAAQSAIGHLTRQAQAVDSPDLSGDTPDAELPFGIPGAYWLDVRGYDPAAAARALGLPVLLLQGGRDYQVTVADDLAAWQAALDGAQDVTTRVYAADNHLFFPGAGPSSPADYEAPQHVDPELISDLADWLWR